MNIFEIQIRKRSAGDDFLVECIYRELNTSPIHSPGTFEIKEWKELHKLADDPAKSLKYGKWLGEALFKNQVRDEFVKAVGKGSNENPLQVLLSIKDEDENLKKLYWQNLCFPREDNNWVFLRFDPRVTFSIYVPSPIDSSRFPPISKRDLHALLLVASPKDDKKKLYNFDIEETVEQVKKALQKIITVNDFDKHCDVLANLDNIDESNAPTLTNLLKKLEQKKYTLLHIVCHGMLTLDETDTMLYWANADSQVERILGARLIEELKTRGYQLPHFTFLCACKTASPEEIGALGGLAGRLVRELGMPAVVAMTDNVKIETAMTVTERFYEHLNKSGKVDLALARAVPADHAINDIIVSVLFSRLAGQPLLNNSLEKPLNDEDIKRGLKRLFEVNQNPENEMPDDSGDEPKNQTPDDSNSSKMKYVSLIQKHAPILQGEFEKEQKILEKIGKINPDQRNTEAKKKQNNALQNLNNLCQEVFSHQYNKNFIFNDLAFMEDLPPYDARCPFRGLLSFGLKSREFFFGREEYINELKQKLEDNKFVAVIGGSGSGKSSLVKAGLISKLLEDSKLTQEELKQIVCFTPDKNPYSQLDEHLKKNSLPPILIVDQFEELFTVSHKTERQQFINELLKLINQQNVRVIVTMRVDFWEECATYDDKFREKIVKSQVFILPMTSEELRNAMKRQAQEVGLIFEAGLEKLIQNEVEGEPGAMPLLQHALLELWKRRHGQWLRCDEYEKIGTGEAPGLKGAIAKTADEFIKGLKGEDKDLVQKIFLCLIRVDEEQGDTRRDTRKRVRLQDLPGNPKTTKKLVNELANKRLVIMNKGEVEVAHEALIRHWEQLQTWLKDNLQDLLLRQTIEKGANEWKNQENKEEFLTLAHQEGRLKTAEDLLIRRSDLFTKDGNEDKYVKACVELRDRRRQEEEEREKRKKQLEREILEKALSAIIESSKVLFISNNKLDALAKLIEAGKLLQQSSEISIYVKFQFLVTASQIFNDLAELKSFDGHQNPVYSVAFSPDNQIIASASYDKTIKLWKLDGTSSHTLTNEHTSPITDICFSPDGQILASASIDKSIKLWHKKQHSHEWKAFYTINKAHNDKAHDHWTVSVSFSPNSQIITSASEDKTVKLWSRDGYLHNTLQGHEKGVTCVAFSPDGELIASASKDTTVRIWNRRGECLKTLPHPDVVSGVSFSNENNKLVSSCKDKVVRIWAIEGAFVELNLNEHKEEVCYAIFSQDGKTIASASADGIICLWKKDNNHFRIFKILKGHRNRINKVSFSSNSKILVSCSDDKTVKLWDCQSKFDGYSKKIYSINFSPNGKTLATAYEDGIVKLWNRNGTWLKTFDVHRGNIVDVKFSPNEKTIAIASEDGTVGLWNIDSDGEYRNKTCPKQTSRMRNVSFSPNGQSIAIGYADGTVILWNLDDDQLKILEMHRDLVKVTFNPYGKIIAIVRDNNTVFLSILDDTSHPVLNTHQSFVNHICFSPNSNLVATAIDRQIKVCNHAENQLIPEKNVQSDIRSISFIDKILVSISEDKSVNLWRIDENQIVTVPGNDIYGSNESIDKATFSPDGSAIAVVNYDSTRALYEYRIEVWNLNLDELLKSMVEYNQIVDVENK